MSKKIENHTFLYAIILALLPLGGSTTAEAGLEFPGPAPGDAQGRASKSELILENNVVSCAWDISQGRLKLKNVTDKKSGMRSIPYAPEGECLQLIFEDGRILKASDLKIVGEPELANLQPDRKSWLPPRLPTRVGAVGRLAEQLGGKQITVSLVSPGGDLQVEWRAILRDGSNYVRQQMVVTVTYKPIRVKEVVLLELAAPGAKVMGTVDGSPVVTGNMFFACEHPLSKSQILPGDPPTLRCTLPYDALIGPGQQWVQTSVIGVVPEGQLRRGFLYYIERERAQPYRPFLHYNSWYDIGYGGEKIQQQDLLHVMELFGTELVGRRNVAMDSFVLDDGWDNTASLWQFHSGFPDGFSRLQKAAKEYNAALGAWLSPWGGYGQAKQERMKYGLQEGFETNKSGFSLAGPKYYARFRNVCLNLAREYGLNYFKFDGIGTGGKPTGVPAEFAQDINALLRLITELRAARADLFVNVTTGTWSSPYWLWYCDSTWRAGSDWGTFGWGSKRQQQVTYRDNETYHNVVLRAPLYPLNSLMTQGVMFANHGLPDEPNGLVEDIRAFFASGTNCQELYITPSLLDSQTWDALAEAAKWSRDNSDVLLDTHWIGGDPAKGEVYGWASWSRRKGTMSLRNPHDKPGRITLDIGKAFELPPGAAQKYSLESPWQNDANKAAIVLSAGEEHTFELKPFEVLVFDATPL